MIKASKCENVAFDQYQDWKEGLLLVRRLCKTAKLLVKSKAPQEEIDTIYDELTRGIRYSLTKPGYKQNENLFASIMEVLQDLATWTSCKPDINLVREVINYLQTELNKDEVESFQKIKTCYEKSGQILFPDDPEKKNAPVEEQIKIAAEHAPMAKQNLEVMNKIAGCDPQF